MKNHFLLLLSVLTLLITPAQSNGQLCSDDDDLAKMPGRFVDHKWKPVGGYISDYSTAEKNAAIKTLISIEEICRKKFFGNGTNGKGSFDFREGDYFNNLFLGSYKYNIGFYQLICVNGQLKTAHEYGTSLEITTNPFIPPAFSLPHEFASNESQFYSSGNRKDRNRMNKIFSYLIFENSEEVEKINSGSGYIDSKEKRSDAYDKHPDVYRTWYLIKQGNKLLVEVTRKEYLESLLEYYEKEKTALTTKNEKLLNESKEYMAKYEKNGNKAMYQSHFENKQKAERELSLILFRYTEKKEKVARLLKSKTENWLQQQAVINPSIRNNSYCENASDYKKTGYFTFNNFSESSTGNIVYKWNPEVFKQQAACTPVFFKVSIRHKSGIGFSEAIRDYYTQNLDFPAINKLLGKN